MPFAGCQREDSIDIISNRVAHPQLVHLKWISSSQCPFPVFIPKCLYFFVENFLSRFKSVPLEGIYLWNIQSMKMSPLPCLLSVSPISNIQWSLAERFFYPLTFCLCKFAVRTMFPLYNRLLGKGCVVSLVATIFHLSWVPSSLCLQVEQSSFIDRIKIGTSSKNWNICGTCCSS